MYKLKINKKLMKKTKIKRFNENSELNISDVSDSYAIASLNLMIQRLKNIKNEIRKGNNHIAKQTWKDFKILYDMHFSKHVDDFFNNCH